MNSSFILIIIGLLSIILELILGVATGFDLLLIGASLVLGGFAGIVTKNEPLGVIVAAIASVAYLLIGRRLVRQRLISSTTSRSNSDALVGKEAVVVKANQVKVDNEVWRSTSDNPLAVGDKVKIISVEGVTVKVVKF